MGMGTELKKFIIMLEWYPQLKRLTNEELGILFRNLFNHHLGLPIDESDRVSIGVFEGLLPNIDRMNQKYLKDIENGKKGGAPKGNNNASKQPKNNPQSTQEQPKDNVKTTYKEKEKEKEKYNDIINITSNRTSGENLDEVINNFWEKRK
jgi:hypothetical protein